MISRTNLSDDVAVPKQTEAIWKAHEMGRQPGKNQKNLIVVSVSILLSNWKVLIKYLINLKLVKVSLNFLN